jgi:hypothetical protein
VPTGPLTLVGFAIYVVAAFCYILALIGSGIVLLHQH